MAFDWRPPDSERGRPRLPIVAVVGIVAALVIVAIVVSVLTLPSGTAAR